VDPLFWLGFALAASPGPDFLLMTRNTLWYGRNIGYLTLLGNRCSLLIHMTLAILGLSALLQQSVTLFSFIRVAGALYLVYLGLKSLSGKWKAGFRSLFSSKTKQQNLVGANPPAATPTPWCSFRDGFFSNLLNPKVSLFFLSLFPQFTHAGVLAEHPLAVGLVFFAGNCCWYLPILFFIGTRQVRSIVHRFQQWLDVVFGLGFIAVGIGMIREEWRNHRFLFEWGCMKK
jgi:threonine/homoserine/homoserine lactone efflux protein